MQENQQIGVSLLKVSLVLHWLEIGNDFTLFCGVVVLIDLGNLGF